MCSHYKNGNIIYWASIFISTNEQQRLLLKLLPLIHYKGSENKRANSLSRWPQHADFMAIAIPIPMDFNDWQAELQADPYTKQIMEQVSAQPLANFDFHLTSNYVFYKSRLVIPNSSPLKGNILVEAHNTPLGGHGGFLKTLKCVSANFFWMRLKKDVKVFMPNCLICQQKKYQTLAPAGLLYPLPLPQRIWEDISIDFIIGLPSYAGYDTIMVVFDRFSKYVHFLALSHPHTTKAVANLFCKEIIRLHSLRRSILSNRDVIFLCSFW